MKLNRKAYIIIFIFLSAFLLFLKYSIDRNNMRKQIDQLLKSSEAQLLDSSNFKHTVFTPVLDIKINTTENFVYCSSFQNAWNNFRSEVFEDTLEISAADSAEIIMKLEEALSQKATLDDEYHVSLAGRGRDGIVSKINAELMEKFKTNHFDAEIKTDEVLIYSRFKKTYSLEYPLDSIIEHKLESTDGSFAGEISYECFGIEDNIIGDKTCENQVSQIDVLYGKDTFWWEESNAANEPICYPRGVILRFKLKNCDDEFIMASDNFMHFEDTENTLLKLYYEINDIASNKKFNYINLKVFYIDHYFNEEFFGSKFDGFSQKVKKINIEDIRSDTKQEFLEKFREKAGLDEIEFKMLCKYIDEMDERMNTKYRNPKIVPSRFIFPKLDFKLSIAYPLFSNAKFRVSGIQDIDLKMKFSAPSDIKMFYEQFSLACVFMSKPILYIKKKNAKLPYFMVCMNNSEIFKKDDAYLKYGEQYYQKALKKRESDPWFDDWNEYYYEVLFKARRDSSIPKIKTSTPETIIINGRTIWRYKILNKDQFIDRN